MVASYQSYQAVLLAGGDAISTKRLHPLTTGMTRALLPVGNKPLILYSLRTFLDAGVKHVIVVSLLTKANIRLAANRHCRAAPRECVCGACHAWSPTCD